MESLALAAAVVMLSLWGCAAGAIVCSYLQMRLMAAALGLLSILGGLWLLRTLPHAPLLWLINIAAGVVGLMQLLKR